MKVVLVIIIVIFALLTLFVLIKGVVGMAQQKDITGQRSQELMRTRIKYQAITILFAVVLLALMSSGG
jgi:uncharacterized membrane protein